VDTTCDTLILGAGAAGLMCAIEAAKRGRRVLVLERAERIGKKILISGGGRCNFTNRHATADNFISANPHFVKSALARYTPTDFISLIAKHRIGYHEKKLGQLFCDRSANDIIQMLENECRAAGVTIQTNIRVREVTRSDTFIVRTEASTFRSSALVVATGGLSVPKMGATSFGYDLAKQFGLTVQTPRPALVPFVFSDLDRNRWCDLAGVSTEVVASVRGRPEGFREKMLFTHRGLSGPAILQISSYWHGKEPIQIDLAPDRELCAEFKQRGYSETARWKNVLREALPQRLAKRWTELHPLMGSSTGDLADGERKIHRWTIVPQGTEGFAKAEVTAGGVDTSELSSRTMESRRVAGLFVIGEVVDVTGQLGGFNFQWAWASGFCAGQAV